MHWFDGAVLLGTALLLALLIRAERRTARTRGGRPRLPLLIAALAAGFLLVVGAATVLLFS